MKQTSKKQKCGQQNKEDGWRQTTLAQSYLAPDQGRESGGWCKFQDWQTLYTLTHGCSKL